MNGPSGQENSPWAFPDCCPSSLWKFFQPRLLGRRQHTQGANPPPTPASAPTKNIPVVLPNKLIAFPQGSLHDNRCPPLKPPVTVSGFCC